MHVKVRNKITTRKKKIQKTKKYRKLNKITRIKSKNTKWGGEGDDTTQRPGETNLENKQTRTPTILANKTMKLDLKEGQYEGQVNKNGEMDGEGTMFYKPIIDILYLLSSLYDKTYILKPNTSNITSFEKYIVCKGFQINEEKNTNLRLNYFRLLVFLKKFEGKNVDSILDYEVPYYFKMKLDDINIIIGQQQIESLDLLINIIKNKNKEDKIDAMKKTNIQKSVAWCEKYKIPCNKFSEKTNIFLPINKEFKNIDSTDVI
jgi:hypothetical protein